ncbi:MAG: prolipoprotein diacylglyceryl transferase family protein [Candidatus Woesearchaeota archaeon]
MIPYRLMPSFYIAGIHIGVAPLMSTLGFVVMGYLAAREAKKIKLFRDRNESLLFFLLFALCSLAGGRIWYFTEHFDGAATIRQFFNVFEPGLASFGMIIGGAVFLALWTRKHRKGSFALLADVTALYTPLFIAIYRIGCYFNGCCYGIRTNVAWALKNTITGVARHPSQVYEIASALLIFVILKHMKKRFKGEIALWFLVLYATGRFITDFFRYYPEHYLGLSITQFYCLGIFLIGSFLLTRKYLIIYRTSRA